MAASLSHENWIKMFEDISEIRVLVEKTNGQINLINQEYSALSTKVDGLANNINDISRFINEESLTDEEHKEKCRTHIEITENKILEAKKEFRDYLFERIAQDYIQKDDIETEVRKIIKKINDEVLANESTKVGIVNNKFSIISLAISILTALFYFLIHLISKPNNPVK